MSTIHVTCPFPPCTSEWWIGREPAQTRITVPFHWPEGDFPGHERYGDTRCPGAMAMYDCSTNDLALVAVSAEQINRAYENYLLWLAKTRDEQAAERERREEFLNEVERIEGDRRREEDQRQRDLDAQQAGPHIGGPVGRPVDWDRPREEYFPGRPADAPEPGPDEPPAAPLPKGVEGHHLGRDAVDDSHAATVGLTRLALEQHARAQEALSVVTELLERATAMAAVAETHVQSANALVISAVGTGAGKPAPGEAMAEQTALAVDTLSGTEGGNLHNAINLAKIRAETAHQQIAGATSNGQAYIGLLGG